MKSLENTNVKMYSQTQARKLCRREIFIPKLRITFINLVTANLNNTISAFSCDNNTNSMMLLYYFTKINEHSDI